MILSLSPRISISPTLRGIFCGVGAGALWGVVFLTPEVAGAFTPLELTIGRYAAYGVIALVLIAPRWPRLRPLLTGRDWLTLARLALLGNSLYYILLASAVQLGGVAMTSLVIGFLPVIITLIGSREHGAVPLQKLAPSLALCGAGAVCIGWQAIAAPLDGGGPEQIIGFCCAIGALVSWTAFTVGNRRALKSRAAFSAQDWNLLTGTMTGAQALVLISVALLLHTGGHTAAQWSLFAGVSIGSAVLASILGNALWNRMSQLLPLTLVGQMILFETMFALLYGFLWEQRLPTAVETTAFILVAASVVSCIHSHRTALPKPAALAGSSAGMARRSQ